MTSTVWEPSTVDPGLFIASGPGTALQSMHQSRTPFKYEDGLHCLCLHEIPFLPEPEHERDFSLTQMMRQMFRCLHEPDPGALRGLPFHITPCLEVRISNTRGADGMQSAMGLGAKRICVVVIAKAFAFDVDRKRTRAELEQAATQHVRRMSQVILRTAPRALTLSDESFELRGSSSAAAYLERFGVARFAHFGELRSALHTDIVLPTDFQKAEKAAGEIKRCVPVEVPDFDMTLLPTCKAILAADLGAGLSVRAFPTSLTATERFAVEHLRRDVRRELDDADQTIAFGRVDAISQNNSALRRLASVANSGTLFECIVQVAANDRESLSTVLTAAASECSTVEEYGIRGQSPVMGLDDGVDQPIAEYNWLFIERSPWGHLVRRIGDKATPTGRPPDGIRRRQERVKDEELYHLYRHRDLCPEPSLTRLRRLLDAGEASKFWAVPRVQLGGERGLASRAQSPFEQMPLPHVGDDAIDFGVVQYRNRSSGQHFRIPFKKGDGSQSGISDRAIVVAGSPGSGKTNLCLYLLEQLWRENGVKYPYLVIDPTRGNEFRYLLRIASNDLVVFTVGDPRCVPFCFNPFIVPFGTSTQGHISRLMSCFKAAYHMWDPLPAIFEMALRQAYIKKFTERGVGKKTVGGASIAWEEFGTGRNDDYPQLSDLCEAMGDPTSKGTVLYEQAKMWGADTENGGTTENASTIVASTSLRLNNLRDNYEQIIGGSGEERQCVDLAELLEKPVVLELGMIGDSQALSLIMGFLVVSLAGNIENRTRSDRLRRTGRVPGKTPVERHMLVLEEAHRLLAGGDGGSEGASSKAKAAEDLNEMLAEVRKYGQGIMILDQRPGSLVGGVIDNAYLIAMHRLNEQKSFEQFASILGLTRQQQRYVRTELRPGEMVIFDKSSRIPVLVRPPALAKEEAGLMTVAREVVGSDEDILREVSALQVNGETVDDIELVDDDALLAIIMRERAGMLCFRTQPTSSSQADLASGDDGNASQHAEIAIWLDRINEDAAVFEQLVSLCSRLERRENVTTTDIKDIHRDVMRVLGRARIGRQRDVRHDVAITFTKMQWSKTEAGRQILAMTQG